jgi:hypothetical protein
MESSRKDRRKEKDSVASGRNGRSSRSKGSGKLQASYSDTSAVLSTNMAIQQDSCTTSPPLPSSTTTTTTTSTSTSTTASSPSSSSTTSSAKTPRSSKARRRRSTDVSDLHRSVTSPRSDGDSATRIGLHHFQVIRLIGCGAASTVFLVQLRTTQSYFAMKVITKQYARQNEKTIASVLVEKQFLSTPPSHPFINKLYYAFHTPTYLLLILEYCGSGDLLSAIKRQPEGRLNGVLVGWLVGWVNGWFDILLIDLDMTQRHKHEHTWPKSFLHWSTHITKVIVTEVRDTIATSLSLSLSLCVCLFGCCSEYHLCVDIKPENIMIHDDAHIRLINFGLAKHQSDYRVQPKVHVKRSIFRKVC